MHHSLVSYLAWRFMDRGEPLEDIIQQGVIGLIQALDHFDLERGVRFSSFASPTIVGEIRRYFRDKNSLIRVPRRTQELYYLVNQKVDLLTQELNRSPTYVEIARSLNREVEEVIEALELGNALDPVSLDEPFSSADGVPAVLSDMIGGPDHDLEFWNDKTALQAALSKLSGQERSVLHYAYTQGYSQAEIARHLRVSQMHVSRLLRRALTKLRAIMASEEN